MTSDALLPDTTPAAPRLRRVLSLTDLILYGDALSHATAIADTKSNFYSLSLLRSERSNFWDDVGAFGDHGEGRRIAIFGQ